MNGSYFVNKDSILRQIWGKSDTVLFIFAGAAAEFALNKAVDWLYFTGRLPADPLGRLFSTVSYARTIVFANHDQAMRTIHAMNGIHSNVETKRGSKIPDWAYRDVLFMLTDYSIRAFEVLERKLTHAEKARVFSEFNRLGIHMGVNGLPSSFEEWERMREAHLIDNLFRSHYTDDLFKQYRKHLGPVRYRILLEAQALVAPDQVRKLLGFRQISLLRPVVMLFKVFRTFKIDWLLKQAILPSRYKTQIQALDVVA